MPPSTPAGVITAGPPTFPLVVVGFVEATVVAARLATMLTDLTDASIRELS